MYTLLNFMHHNTIKKSFFEHGFVVVKNVLSKKKIAEIFIDLEEIKKLALKRSKQFYHLSSNGKFNSIHNINGFRKKGAIIKICKNSKITKIVEKIFDEKVTMRNIEFFLKPKKKGLKAPFHQDNFYWNIKESKALNVWIACSPASKKNGGLCYLKGSHILGTINHEMSFMKGSSQKISDNIMNNLSFKKIFPTMNAGDVLFHHCEIIHGSSKNISNQDRIGLAISFKTKSAKINKEKLIEYKKKLKKSLNKIYK